MGRTLSLRGIGEIYRPLLIFFAMSVFALQLSRFLLIAVYWKRVDTTGGLSVVMLQGLRFDVLVISALVIMPAIVHPLLCHRKSWQRVLTGYLIAAFGFLILMEAATPTFMTEFDLRVFDIPA